MVAHVSGIKLLQNFKKIYQQRLNENLSCSLDYLL